MNYKAILFGSIGTLIETSDLQKNHLMKLLKKLD